MIGCEDEVERLTRGRAWLATLVAQRVTVVGLAKSGVAAARLLRAAGCDVTGTDAHDPAALPSAGDLRVAGVRLLMGEAAFEGADLVVVSPGVPPAGAQLAPARRRGLPIIGELELGWRAMEADTIAITGTNGKTTTTALTGALVAALGRPVLVGGNIGTPLTEHALDFPADGLVVAEVSSFQLETIDAFRPRVAAVLNVTPDHLDRHGTFERYVDAKARIFDNQTAADVAVLNADDAAACGLASRTRATVLECSRHHEVARGTFLAAGWIVARLDGGEERVCPLTELRLRGRHNVDNVLAATACALAVGVAADAARRAIAVFEAVEHRIELVRRLDGVAFYNDSKGTNVDSTTKALESFDERVVLIAGGKGKGQDFAPLARAARGRVSHAVLIGEDAPKIAAALEGAGIPVHRARDMRDAVVTARRHADAGDVVLLSPACASFDMFDNYEHRGRVFKDLVRGLA